MRKPIFLIFVAMLLLPGCGKLHPYCVDIQQGNIIDTAMIAKLHLGMNKSEVNDTLGTPVLKDMFDTDTWIYAYTNQIGGGKIEKKKLILRFKNSKLVEIK
ncbi:MAG: hypothetical protein ACD_5C00001G0002 [uncultured bacterium]|nr:MAG: hypothetical protein ACD_5C00001G0002 [uncultured bacterium]OGT09177.1 MAG: hypothetical protein A2V89_00560 [Gammaproteobacteria bacterium RBG_16_37_9]